MTDQLLPDDADNYRELREYEPAALYREGTRKRTDVGEPTGRALVIACLASHLTDHLTGEALALLGATGLVNLATHLVDEYEIRRSTLEIDAESTDRETASDIAATIYEASEPDKIKRSAAAQFGPATDVPVHEVLSDDSQFFSE